MWFGSYACLFSSQEISGRVKLKRPERGNTLRSNQLMHFIVVNVVCFWSCFPTSRHRKAVHLRICGSNIEYLLTLKLIHTADKMFYLSIEAHVSSLVCDRGEPGRSGHLRTNLQRCCLCKFTEVLPCHSGQVCLHMHTSVSTYRSCKLHSVIHFPFFALMLLVVLPFVFNHSSVKQFLLQSGVWRTV